MRYCLHPFVFGVEVESETEIKVGRDSFCRPHLRTTIKDSVTSNSLHSNVSMKRQSTEHGKAVFKELFLKKKNFH